MPFFNHRKLLPILIAVSALLVPGSSAATGDGVVRMPQMTFELERRQFYFQSDDLETTTPMRLEATEESLHERGFTSGHYHEALDLAYIQRRSLVDVRVTGDGEMLYLERMPDDAAWDYSAFLHQLTLPVGPHPNQTINTLMALHPYTMLTEEFEIIRELNEPLILSREEEDGLEKIYTPDWIYHIHRDPETQRLLGVEQYVADHGWLFRETSFEDWEEAPSGRVLPTRVHTRTYFEGRWPYTELIFTAITENEVPDFSGD